MFKLLVFLCAGVFLTLLIAGQDEGQARFGLQGAYGIAALQEGPVVSSRSSAQPAVTASAPAAVQAQAAPTPTVATKTARVTEAAFTPSRDDGTALQTGLTLSLPLVTEAAAEPTVAIEVAATPAPLRVSRVLGSTVNVREGPSAKSAVVDRLTRDEMVTVISTDGSGWSWVRVEGDGIEGYIATRYLSDPITDTALFPSE